MNEARQWRQLVFGAFLDPTGFHLYGCGVNLGSGCLAAVCALPLLLLLWPVQVVLGWRARGAADE